MASVHKIVRSSKDGASRTTRWRVSWRAPDGHQRTRAFARKLDADNFRKTIDAQLVAGDYRDPRAGRVLFGTYAEKWLAAQPHAPGTAWAMRSRFDGHILPRWGDVPLNGVQRLDVQRWVTDLASKLAPSTVRVTFSHFRSVMRSAQHDRLVLDAQCARIALPRAEGREVVPLAGDELAALLAAVPPRFRAWIIAGVGLGLRQGELCGLAADRVDPAAATVRVDQQLVTPNRGKPYLAEVKTPSSVRTIPLPTVVAAAIEDHRARYSPGPWGLIFATAAGEPIRRNRAADVIRRAVAKAALDPSITPHTLRHTYASALIDAGASVKVVQARLGHRSALETLDVYGHLWPGGEADTIAAIDAMFRACVPPDHPQDV